MPWESSSIVPIACLSSILFLPTFQEENSGGLPWWAWLLILIVALYVIWWLISRQTKYSPSIDEKTITHTPPVETAAAPEAAAPKAEDDLTIIEGIGPKIASLLHEAGITTFHQLAAAEINRLREILNAAGLRLNDPTTWPEQARLAAAGNWDELKKLQDALKGGRKE